MAPLASLAPPPTAAPALELVLSEPDSWTLDDLEHARKLSEAAAAAQPHKACDVRTQARFAAPVSDRRIITRARAGRVRGGHEPRPSGSPLAEQEARE
jgi:hypothetical protein